nr:hypothetical protein [Kibdelosporangium sp. MJ126-NF4]
MGQRLEILCSPFGGLPSGEDLLVKPKDTRVLGSTGLESVGYEAAGATRAES